MFPFLPSRWKHSIWVLLTRKSIKKRWMLLENNVLMLMICQRKGFKSISVCDEKANHLFNSLKWNVWTSSQLLYKSVNMRVDYRFIWEFRWSLSIRVLLHTNWGNVREHAHQYRQQFQNQLFAVEDSLLHFGQRMYYDKKNWSCCLAHGKRDKITKIVWNAQ